jgi:hypothetical protein
MCPNREKIGKPISFMILRLVYTQGEANSAFLRVLEKRVLKGVCVHMFMFEINIVPTLGFIPLD